MTDGVMFHFGSDIADTRAEIEANLRAIVTSVQESARSVAGTSVPSNWGDQIVRGASHAADQSRQALAGMLDPRALNFDGSAAAVTQAIRQATVGAVHHAELELDRALKQLSPAAQLELAQTGQIHDLMAQVTRAIALDARQAYTELRNGLDRELQQMLPAPGKLTGIRPDNLFRYEGTGEDIRARGYLANQVPLVGDAQRARIDRLFPRDEEGNVDYENPLPDATLAAAQAARTARQQEQDRQERVAQQAKKAEEEVQRAGQKQAQAERLDRERTEKIEKEKTKRLEQQARERTTRALAETVGNRDPYAEGLGYRINPLSGLPTRKVGGEYADITNINDQREALSNIQALRDAHSQTLALMNDPAFSQIKGSRFARVGDDPSNATYYEKQTRGAHELWVEINNVAGKTRSLVDAQNAYNRELDQSAKLAAKKNAADSTVRGFIPGVASGAFGSGFNGSGPLDKGAILGNLGKTVGSAARYSLAYGGFYQFTQAAGQALSIFEDYQDSFTDYEVALGNASGATQSYTNELMEMSRVVGENVGAAYDSAARGVRAFASDLDEAEKKAAGTSIASASQKIAVIANKSLGDATGDSIAIGTGFGLNAQQTELLVPDAIANAKRTLGGDPAQIAQGLSNFAVTAQEAGYSLQEAANLISLVQAKTDQTGQAVSTRLSRIVSIVGGTTGKGLAREINRVLGEELVDVNALPKEQIEQIAKAYVEAGQRGLGSLQGLIRSQIGGTSNLRELLPLLEDQPRLQKALGDAIPGAGNDEYKRKTENLIGTLNKIKASVQNLVVLAANADLFAPFAAAVGVLEPVLHTLEGILQVYEKIEGILPGPTGGILTTGVEVGAAALGVRALRNSAFAGDVAANNKGLIGSFARTAGGASAAANEREAAASNGAATSNVRLAEASNLAAAALGRINLVAATRPDAGDLLGGPVGQSSRRGLLTRGLTSGIGMGAIAIGGLMAIDKTQRDDDTFNKYADKIFRAQGAIGSDPETLRNNADALDALARNSQRDLGSVFGVNNLLTGKNASDLMSRGNDTANDLRDIASRISLENAQAEGFKKTQIFGDAAARTADSLAEALQGLDDSGLTATGRLRELQKALLQPPDTVPGSTDRPLQFSADVASAVSGAFVTQYDKLLDDAGKGIIGSAMFAANGGKSKFRNSLKIDEGQLFGDISKGVKAQGQNLNQADLNDIIDKAVNNQSLAGAMINPGKLDEYRQRVKDSLVGNIKINERIVSSVAPISDAELESLISSQAAALEEVDPSDPTARLKALRRNYAYLIKRRAAAGTQEQSAADATAQFTANNGAGFGDIFGGQVGTSAAANIPALGRDIAAAGRAVKVEAFNEAEIARRVIEARNNNKGDRAQAAGRLAAATNSLQVAGNDVALLVQLFEALDRKTVRALIEYQRTAVKIQREAFRRAAALVQTGITLLNPGGTPGDGDLFHGTGILGTSGDENVARFKKKGKQLSDAEKALNASLKAAVRSIIPDATFPGGKDKDAAGEKLTAAQQSALRNQALTDPDNTIAAAKANLAVAKANLAAIKPKDRDTSGYFSALQAVTQAQDGLAKAYASQSAAAAQAVAAQKGGALASARAQLIAARAQLNSQARGTTGWLQALAGFYQAQQAMRDAVTQYRNNLDLLSGDSTDPVEQARDALRAARRKLRADRGMGKDVLAEDRVAAQEARSGLLGARFDQKFSDMQTAEDLGRISFSKYMSYLDSEHDRLTKIKHRTRQQQDQLDQVDRAMKEAKDSMDGQFNLGDINTNGLVYQVRRFKAEARTQAASAQIANSTQVNQTVTIAVNGADTAKVRSILDTYLNISGGQRRTLTRRKI